MESADHRLGGWVKDRALQCGFCKHDPVGAAGGIRLCARHRDLVEAIAHDAGVDDVTISADLSPPKRGRPRRRRDLLDDDYLPDVSPSPPRARSHPMSATVARTFAPKTCEACKREFTPKGSYAKFCGRDDCSRGSAAPAKAEKPEKKRKRIKTGFRSELPRATARHAAPPQHDPDSLYQRRLTEIEGELERYQQLIVERDALQQLIQTVDGSAPSNGNGHKKARR